MSRHKRCV
uniref:Uncharacterized protein n=1 Tax=Anguilla anguilla TaxID=7936 RepID=A0A0E9ULI0_ANGAN